MCYTKCWKNRNVDFMTKIDEEEIAKTSDEIINKIEKFFMTGKGMLYDVHFWKNDICNSTELIYQKCYLFRQEHDLSRVCESFSVNRIFRSSMIKYKIIGGLILWQEKRNRYTKYK